MAIVETGWTRIQRDIDSWNTRLLGTNGHLYQYPYWNEPLRQIHLSPDYVVYGTEAEPQAFACILRIGVPGFKIGIVRGGPVGLNGPLPEAAIDGLVKWSRSAGYSFIRFSHEDAGLLQHISEHGSTDREDALPFYPPLEHELIVEQLADDDETAGRFQSVARRNIRDARKANYQIERSETIEALERAMPVFAALSKRKGQVYSRPMSSYVDLLRLAIPHRGARVYTALVDGKAVQVLLIVRDRDTAHYVIGALDSDALGDHASPGCLLHWQAMRDFYSEGARFYNLGLWGSDGLHVFKSKFRPVEKKYPRPLTLILRPMLYRLWTRTLPILKNSRPRIEQLMTALRELRAQS